MNQINGYCENSQLVQQFYRLHGSERRVAYASRQRLLGRLWPDGEFAVWLESPKLDMGSHMEGLPVAAIAAVPLGSSKVTNSQKPAETCSQRAKRGSHGITSYGRRMLRNGCYLLEQSVPKPCLSFLTLTLPTSIAGRSDCAQRWPYAMKLLMQYLREQLQGAGLPGEIVSAVELQEKRLENFGGCTLHAHLVFQGRPSMRSPWTFTPQEYRQLWQKVLETAYEKNLDGEMDATENVQQVKKSCYQYLSKYISKGVALLQGHQMDPGQLASICPSAWWHMTMALRQRVKRSVRYGENVGELLEKLLLSQEEKIVAWTRKIEISGSDGRKIHLGTVGGLARSGMRRVGMLLNSVPHGAIVKPVERSVA